MSMSQKDAVFQAVTTVLEENNIHFEEGQTEVKPLLTTEMRRTIQSLLYQGFKSGTIALSANYDDKKLHSYCNEIISNHTAKDKRLNGGIKFEIKNPGSRAHVGDAALKNMQLLLLQTKDESIKATIQAEIDKHVANKPTKPTKQVDFSKLPDSLKALLDA